MTRRQVVTPGDAATHAEPERRRAAAARFGVLLRRAMTRRAMTGVTLGSMTGISAPDISEARHGGSLPSLPRAGLLADALDWPGLVELMVELRTSACTVCGATFVDGTNALRQLYCTPACGITIQNRKRRDSRGDAGILERNRLATLQQAVAAYCRGCEPAGLCRDAECPLRPVSPLPLADRRVRVA